MARYAIGIDLGTTNCALSWYDLEQPAGTARDLAEAGLAIPQLTDVGTVEERPLLPSFLYLPSPDEFPAAGLALPWERRPPDVIGEFARKHGTLVPTRLVASAKSWLVHPGVDRTSALLPWQAPPDVERVSPVHASARYLQHLRAAFERQIAHGDRRRPVETQEVLLTVPASFDAAARELTIQAAQEAGLPQVTLLEEPQAALYAWLERMGDRFRQHLRVGDVILVIDVGGGTTDLSLLAATEESGALGLTRIAVGDHILLGGDNMDLLLASVLQQELAAGGKRLDGWQMASLTYGCRQAKEWLFGNPRSSKAPIAIPARGSALVGGTIRTELRRELLAAQLVDGFFPVSPVGEAPRTARGVGLTQLALPYAQDPAITRHLAAFLTRQARALGASADTPISVKGKSFVHPTAVLFNGGVFKATPLKERVLEVLNGWLAAEGGAPVRELEGADLDLAVSRGAAYYGWVRSGHGIRIRGGTARAYYVGVETPMPAVPGFAPPVKALCAAPFGMEEGTKAEVPPQEFALVVGEPTRFRFFASSVRRDDRVGTTVEDAARDETLEELAPIETTLLAERAADRTLVPVNLQAVLTELGTLELHCLQKDGPGRWKLELNVRMRGDE
jgi:hypothetical protein